MNSPTPLTTTLSSVPSSNEDNPRVKFLCSFNGSILPRPQDGKLRYVGGETRIVSVPRDIGFEELMERMKELFEGVSVLKYQQPDEDLDALVSVVNDDDVTNMMEEYDKFDSGDGFTRLRMFLFSNHEQDDSIYFIDGDERDNERRYVDALNSLNDSPDYGKQQMSEFQEMAPVDDIQLEQYFNHLNLEGSVHNQRNFEMPMTPVNLQRLRIPHLGSVQHQQSLSQRYNEMESPWSPAYYSPRHPGNDFPTSPSSSQYPYGEPAEKFIDRGPPEDYFRQHHVNHSLHYDQIIQPAPVSGDKAGFPGNIHLGSGNFEGNTICDHCHSPFPRKQALDLPNNNGFHQVTNPCDESPPGREAYMSNAEVKFPHPLYNIEQNDRGTLYNESHPHERGWMLHRSHNPGGGMLSDHHIVDNNGMNVTLGHTAYPDGHHVPSRYVHHEDHPRYTGNELLYDQSMATGSPHIYAPHEERGVLPYGNFPYTCGPENPYNGSSHGHISANAFQRPIQSPMHGPVPYEVSSSPQQENGTCNLGFIRTPMESSTRLQVGVENQNPWVETTPQMGVSNLAGFPDNSHDHALKLMPNAYNLEIQHQIPHEPVLLTPDLLNCLNPINPVLETDAAPILHEVINANCLPFEQFTGAKSSHEENTPTSIKKEELEVGRLGYVPQLIESVVAQVQEDVASAATNDAKVGEETAHELDAVDAPGDLELDSDSGTQSSSKIEPTKAEEEAIAKGLQTIKNDDLEEVRELGSGTYGAVYHGKWKGSDVAIKRIKASCFAGRPSERERLIADFWKEALILGSLHHPNVVSFYGIVRDGPDGSLATVTEFMINGSLKQFLQKKDRTIDRRKRLIIAMDASFGMEYLHGKNIVHFDLKCENLLVNMRDPHRPICKIGDLGLSKVKQHTLVSGGVRGTLPWMAPELLSGKSHMVTDKIDVYSFGIVMWELLTGDEPYADMHCASIIGGIVNNSLRPTIPTWCDPEWKSLMESCWCGDPAQRPSFSDISQKLRTMAAAINIK